MARKAARNHDLEAVSVLGDEYALRILQAVTKEPKTAAEIVRIANLPPAACYRRLRALLDSGLIAATGSIPTRSGKPARQFRASVSRVRVVYDGGRLLVDMDLRNGGTRGFVVTLPEENPPAPPPGTVGKTLRESRDM